MDEIIPILLEPPVLKLLFVVAFCVCVCVCTPRVCVCRSQGNVLVHYQSTAIPLLTIQVHHRGLNLPRSSLDLDKHQNPLLSSVLANQMPGSVTLSEDAPTYSQCGPLLSACVCVFLPSLNLPASPVASVLHYPGDRSLWSPSPTYKPIMKHEHGCVYVFCSEKHPSCSLSPRFSLPWIMSRAHILLALTARCQIKHKQMMNRGVDHTAAVVKMTPSKREQALAALVCHEIKCSVNTGPTWAFIHIQTRVVLILDVWPQLLIRGCFWLSFE